MRSGQRPGGNFCGYCGAPLAMVCGACGTRQPRDDHVFCSACGASLTASASTSPPAAPETPHPAAATPPAPAGELRWVSVVFVDLVGFTSWSEEREPDVVRELLSGYFDRARTVVGRYGGEVEKFIGDAVMAVWGARVASEDDAERAVRAALELVSAVEEYGEDAGVVGLRARAGVVTGQVASWSSPGEGLVTGDRVNTAARVQAAAQPGEVLVDEATRVAAQAAIAFEPAGSHQVKGKAEPLVLARALRVVAGVSGSQRVDGLEAGLVGRARELALVKELFHATEEGGRARLVLVSGVAGVGKSRLGWEFEKYADGLSAGVWWHRGRCLSYGDGVAFWALAEMVRQRFDIAQNESAGSVVRKLAELLPGWVPDEAERDFVFPRLGALLGAGEVELSREELFAGWRLLLERMAASQPVVLVIEDLHWADAGLLDFIEYLLEWSADVPIFVLALSRPELAERRPGWLADRRNATSIQLDPLDNDAVGALLDGLVPAMPAGARSRIVDRAEGVPLYAVETVRSLIDRDLVVPREGAYTLAGDIGDLDVPPTLTSLLAARLDLLSHDERELVKGLAVLGNSFASSAVPAVSDLPVDQADQLLRRLVHKEVLTVRNDPLSPERGEYAFTQTMLRSVAHDLLTRRERTTRHLAVAEHLRRTFPNDGEEVAEVIAAHYRDAYDAARDTPEADTLRTQAVAALARAGKRTHSIGAPDIAQQTYLDAAAMATDEPEITNLTEQAARMATLAGRLAEALALFETVRATHQEHHRLVDRARTASDAGWALSRLGRIGEGIELMLTDVETLEGVDEVPLAWLEARLCAALWGAGRNEEATVHVERALALAERHDLPEVKVNALINRGVLHHRASRIQEGLHELTAAVELAEKQGSTYHESIGRLNLGDLLFQADLPGGDEQTQRAVELAHRVGDGFGVSFGHANLAVIRYFTGDWEAAEAAAQQALDTAPDDYERDTQRLPLTLLHIARGRTSAAQAELAALGRLADTDDLQDQASLLVARAAMGVWDDRDETAHAWPRRERHVVLDDHGAYAEGYRLLWPLAAEAALRSGDRDELCELIDKAGNMPGDGLPPYLQAQVGRFRALLAAAEGRHDQVEPSLRAAVDALDELGYPYFRALVQVDLGGWLLTQGRRTEAEPVLADARETFTRLDAQPARNKVDALQVAYAGEGVGS